MVKDSFVYNGREGCVGVGWGKDVYIRILRERVRLDVLKGKFVGTK